MKQLTVVSKFDKHETQQCDKEGVCNNTYPFDKSTKMRMAET